MQTRHLTRLRHSARKVGKNSSKYIFIKKRGEREDINEIKMRILVEHWYHRTTMYIRFQFFYLSGLWYTFANRVMREIERERVRRFWRTVE